MWKLAAAVPLLLVAASAAGAVTEDDWAAANEPLWPYQEYNFLTIIDDVQLDNDRRYARSMDSPGARRAGGTQSSSSGSRNTGATHPGYNRRNARSVKPSTWERQRFPPFSPTPTFPRPSHPFDPIHIGPQLPLYARNKREVNFSVDKEPNCFSDDIIDDLNLDDNRRYARSVDSPDARRGGGTQSTSSGSRDTGATHPGYNRRNARSVNPSTSDFLRYPPFPLPPTFPKPMGGTYPGYNRRYARSISPSTSDFLRYPPLPSPTFPRPENPFSPAHGGPQLPLLARSRREAATPPEPKREVVITGWNPQASRKSWQVIKHRF